jgi:hypothetical protein
MDKPLKLIGKALRAYWDEAFTLMVLNLIWLVAQVLIIPGPAATAALFYVTHRVARGQFARLSDFWGAFNRFFLSSWKWGAPNLLVVLVLGYAAYFYALGPFPQPYAFVLMCLNLVLLAGWLFLQLFALPFWVDQADQRVGLALRNAVVMLAHNLRLAALVLAIMIALLALTVAFWILLGMVTVALLAMVGNTAVAAQLDALEQTGDSMPAE